MNRIGLAIVLSTLALSGSALAQVAQQPEPGTGGTTVNVVPAETGPGPVGAEAEQNAEVLPDVPVGTGGVPGVSTPAESAATQPHPGGAHNFSTSGN